DELTFGERQRALPTEQRDGCAAAAAARTELSAATSHASSTATRPETAGANRCIARSSAASPLAREAIPRAVAAGTRGDIAAGREGSIGRCGDARRTTVAT